MGTGTICCVCMWCTGQNKYWNHLNVSNVRFAWLHSFFLSPCVYGRFYISLLVVINLSGFEIFVLCTNLNTVSKSLLCALFDVCAFNPLMRVHACVSVCGHFSCNLLFLEVFFSMITLLCLLWIHCLMYPKRGCAIRDTTCNNSTMPVCVFVLYSVHCLFFNVLLNFSVKNFIHIMTWLYFYFVLFIFFCRSPIR